MSNIGHWLLSIPKRVVDFSNFSEFYERNLDYLRKLEYLVKTIPDDQFDYFVELMEEVIKNATEMSEKMFLETLICDERGVSL